MPARRRARSGLSQHLADIVPRLLPGQRRGQLGEAVGGRPEGPQPASAESVDNSREVRSGVGAGAEQPKPAVVDVGEGERRPIAAGAAEDHQPATQRQAGDRTGPGGSARVIEDEVGAMPAGAIAYRRRNVIVVVHQHVSAELTGDGQLLVVAGDRDYPRACPLSQLDHRDADGAGRGLYDHPLTLLNLPDPVGGPPGGTPGGWQHGYVVEVDMAGQAMSLLFGHRYVLVQTTRHVSADDPQPRAVPG